MRERSAVRLRLFVIGWLAYCAAAIPIGWGVRQTLPDGWVGFLVGSLVSVFAGIWARDALVGELTRAGEQ